MYRDARDAHGRKPAEPPASTLTPEEGLRLAELQAQFDRDSVIAGHDLVEMALLSAKQKGWTDGKPSSTN